MKRLQTFENYDPNRKATLDITRQLSKTKFFHITSKILSVIDDLVHLHLGAAVHSFKNKSGFNKLTNFAKELGLLKSLYLNDETLSFQDLKDYEFDPNLIDVLDEPDVIEYMKHDDRVKGTLDKMKNLIDFLREYQEWSFPEQFFWKSDKIPTPPTPPMDRNRADGEEPIKPIGY